MTFTSSFSAFPATAITTTIATRNARRKKRWSLHRANLFGKPNTGETATKESLQYELEKANKWREELVAELSLAKKERDEAVESLDLYKRRLKEAEKDVFKLEKLTQEQEQKFNAFEIVVKNQIKLLEGMVKERDEMLAKAQPPSPPSQ
jgi:chromosome segregation ATPase